MIDQKLLEILACPLCKTEVKLQQKNGQEYLVCVQCKRMYPIRENIPVMLIEEAVIENTKSGSSD